MLLKNSFWFCSKNSKTFSHLGKRYMSSGVSIRVLPPVSLVDEKLKTVVSGLRPSQKVSLEVSVTNNANLDYYSLTHYQASESGVLDLDKAAPVTGAYRQVDPMSIFWTMKPKDNSDQRFWSVNVEEGLHCKFQVYDGHLSPKELSISKALASENQIKREYMAHGVERIKVEHGRIRGTLFLPPGPGPFPSLIKIYGGIHRGQVIEDKAALFASRGFASLALAFFGVKDLPISYATQPLDLDYFEEAVDYLLSRDDVDSSKGVGVCGISKGGEIAYLMSAFMGKKVSAIAVMNSIINCGLVPAVYKGKTVVPGFSNQMDSDAIKLVGKDLYDMLGALRDHRGQRETISPFAKSDSRVLIISGEDDKCCNSVQQAEYAEELMVESGKKNYEIQKYPGLGHLIDLPFAPPTTTTNHALFPKPAKLVMGGDDLQKHVHAQEVIWQELIKFFRQS